MPNEEWTKKLFATIDAMDAKGFAEFITADGQFRMGSIPAAVGTEAIEAFVGGFFGTLKAIRHENLKTWSVDEGKTLFVGGDVIYTLPNDAEVSIAFLNHFTMVGDKVQDYLVYSDPSPLAEAAAA